LNGDEGNNSASAEELPLDVVESAAPARPKGRAKSTKATQPTKATGKKNPAKVQATSAKQMTLGFETAGTSAKRSQKIGKRHGAKKAKK
jgi:hypothetical protein